jgi:hypothetical protein
MGLRRQDKRQGKGVMVTTYLDGAKFLPKTQ